MRLLITSRSFGSIGQESKNILKENKIKCDYKKKKALYTEEDFLQTIHKYDAIIIGADELSAKVIKKGSENNLKIVCKHGTGVDNIDLKAAIENNVMVTNVPSANASAVADFTFGLIIDVARKISLTAEQVKSGKWEKNIGSNIFKKTLGIVGFGAIGKKVAERSKGFDMKVIAYDPYLKQIPKDDLDVKFISFEEVLKKADFLTIHVPLDESTKKLINEKEIKLMKKGSFLINTSRGGIIDEESLYKYLNEGHLSGAGLDVTKEEPPSNSPLLKLDNIVITSHIASYSQEAINTVSITCARNVCKVLSGEKPDYLVV